MPDLIKNFSYCTLTADITAVATTLAVDSVTRLPTNAELAANDFYMTLDSTLAAGLFEIVKVVSAGVTYSLETVAGVTAFNLQPFLNGTDSAVSERFRFTAAVTVTSMGIVLQSTASARQIGIASASPTSTDTIQWVSARDGSLCYANGSLGTGSARLALPATDLQPGVDYWAVLINADGVVYGSSTFIGGYESPDFVVTFAQPRPAFSNTTSSFNFPWQFGLSAATTSVVVTRGQEGTTAQARTAGTVLKAGPTKGTFDRKASAVGAVKSTLGAGLPAFSGRTPGDRHYDSAAKLDYVLTGAQGATIRDTFDRADSTLPGSTLSSGGRTWVTTNVNAGSQLAVRNNQASSASGFSVGVRTDTGSASGASMSLDIVLTGSESGNFPYTLDLGGASATGIGPVYFQYTPGSGYRIAIDGSYTAATSSGPVAYPLSAGLHTLAVSYNPVGKTWSVSIDGTTIASGTYTGTAGNYAGFDLTGPPVDRYVDNWTLVSNGSLAWTATVVAGLTVKDTVGAGLPAFSGRTAGDHHYDLTASREYVLTGAAGTPITDNFNRPDASLPGSTLSSGGRTWSSTNANAGSQLSTVANRAAAADGFNLGVRTDLGSANGATISLDMIVLGTEAPPEKWLLSLGGTSATSGDVVEFEYRPGFGYRANVDGAGGAFTALSLPAGTHTLSLDYNPASKTWHAAIDGSQVAFGVYVGTAGSWAGFDLASSSTLRADNFTAQPNGTLAWALTQPLGSTVNNTVGAGLPAFTGRTAGDHHYETGAAQDYVLTGTVTGTLVSDSFDGPAGTVLHNTVTPVGAKTWSADSQVKKTGDGAVYAVSGGGSIKARLDYGQSVMDVTAAFGDNTTSPFGVGQSIYGNKPTIFAANVDIGLGGGQEDGGFTLFANSFIDPSNVSQSIVFKFYQITGAVELASVSITLSGAAQVVLRISRTAAGVVRAYVNGTLIYSGTPAGATVGNKAGFRIDEIQGASGWARVESFEVSGVDSRAWTPTTPTQPLGSTVKNTIGAGLPSFGGRSNGDIHFDTGVARAYVHTGSLGAGAVTDNFDYADGPLNGKVTPVGGRTWVADASVIVSGNSVRFTASGTGAVDTNATGARTVSFTYSGDGVNANDQFLYIAATNAPLSGDALYVVIDKNRNAKLRRRVAGTVTDLATLPDLGSTQYPSGSRNAFESSVTAAGYITVKINGIVLFAFQDNPANMGAILTTARFVGFTLTGNAADLFLDDFAASTTSTLTWQPSEPIYLQAQLVTGAVATGTHVLKPGLRVPALSSLVEVVLRCDTAPTGAPITVQVERFNGGASQGIIATASIAAGSNAGSVSGLSAGLAKGDILKFNITSVGSTVSGSDLTASLELR